MEEVLLSSFKSQLEEDEGYIPTVTMGFGQYCKFIQMNQMAP